MPWIDYQASARIEELRKERGLSPEALADAITAEAAEHNWVAPWHGGVDASTIRRIEGTDKHEPLVPSLRVRVLLEAFFEERIWDERRWRKPAARVREAPPMVISDQMVVLG